MALVTDRKTVYSKELKSLLEVSLGNKIDSKNTKIFSNRRSMQWTQMI